MKRCEQHPSRNRSSWQCAVIASALALFLLAEVTPAQAQTFTVLHNFSGGSDGGFPTSTLIFDRAGNLYGTTEYGGTHADGVVFQLKTTRSGGWTFTPIHEFNWNGSGGDGSGPLDYGGLTIAPDGALYGTTEGGGIYGCDEEGTCGVVFQLQPPPTACTSALCPWLESIVYEFNPQSSTYFPISNVVFDLVGNLYGTTYFGAVYELSPSEGSWTQTYDYVSPTLTAGVVLDNAGDLYGVSYYDGAHADGFIFELTPSSSGWTESVLYNFTGGDDGEHPFGGLIFDQAGNLYGSTSSGGGGQGGTIFELSPSGGGWTLQTLCSFVGFTPGSGPESALTLDAAGNLYGTTYGGGAFGDGSVFKATRSGNSWTCTDLYDFQEPTGLFPIGGVAVGANGTLYGTASASGSNNGGVVWKITP